MVALLPSQVEEDVDLAQILAEFGTLPAIVTPMDGPYEEGEMPPAEYRPPDVFATPAGRMTVLVRQVLWRLRRFRRRKGTCCSQYRRGLVRRPGERWRNFDYSLLRQQCLNRGMQWIAFENAQMSLICLARACSIFVGTDLTPIHRFDLVRIVRVVHSASLRTIWR